MTGIPPRLRIMIANCWGWAPLDVRTRLHCIDHFIECFHLNGLKESV